MLNVHSANVTSFKANLENYKMENILDNRNNFWEISCLMLDKIEGSANYLVNREESPKRVK